MTTPTAAPGPSPESRELHLISTVELRIALASTPQTLQPLITKYLAPLLLKLGSDSASVRAKTREVCLHISARLRSTPEVEIPVSRLVSQFRGLGGNGESEEMETDGGEEGRKLRDGIRRFGLVFIGMGLRRVTAESTSTRRAERHGDSQGGGHGDGGRALLKELLALPDPASEKIQARVREEATNPSTRLWLQGLYFLLKVLPTWSFPDRGSPADRDLQSELGLGAAETALLAHWLSRFLLCDRQAFSALPTRQSQDGDDDDAAAAATAALEPPLPALSMAERAVFATWAAARRDECRNAAAFEVLVGHTKVAVATFLFTAVFSDEDRFVPAVIMGADDTNPGLFRVADTMFKQCDFNLESEPLVDQLWGLYFGKSPTVDGVAGREGPGAEEEEAGEFEPHSSSMESVPLRLGARPKLRIRILNLLAKSKIATRNTATILKMVDDQLGEVTNFGLEATKLRTALFAFLDWVARVAAEQDILTIAPQTMAGFHTYVVDQGWPIPGEASGKPMSGSELDMRGKAYESIGTWAARMDFGEHTVDPDQEEATKMDLVQFLFTSLHCDASSPGIQVSIESALGHLLNKFANSMTEATTTSLRKMLIQQITTEIGSNDPLEGSKTVRSTAFAAVRFANRCLPFADCEARWMDLLAIGAGRSGDRHELVEEGTKGLSPYWWSTLNGSQAKTADLEFPTFNELVQHIFGGANGEEMIKEPKGKYRHSLPFAVAFCRNVLIREALQSAEIAVPIEQDWEKKLETVVVTDAKARSAIRGHLRGVDLYPLTTLIDAALTGMSLHLGRCAEIAVQLCGLVPDHVIGGMLDRVVLMKPITVSNNLVTQAQAARLLGMFASHPAYPKADRDDSLHGALNTIRGWKEAVGQEVNRIRGLLLCVTFILSRQALRGTLPADDDFVPVFVQLVLDLLLQSRDNALRSASHLAIGQMMLCLDQTSRDRLDLPSQKIMEQLVGDAKKEQESAVIALGRFVRGLSGEEEPSETAEKALTSLYALHDIKRPESQFAVGEALSVAAAGWNSKATTPEFDLDVSRPSQAVNKFMLEKMLDKIISDSKQTKPSLKKASAIWLLCLIQYIGDEPCVQSRLRQCQAAFARLLSDRDEIVQETGSRGLGLVYEMGDKSLKDDLVRDLVTSFTGGNAKMGGTVTSETELFEPGALPTGDGSVTTYKDIVSLAAEMGDPSLVYRFMNLASNNAIWTGRSAFGRFGLGNVLANSAYLTENKSFYPKLYRYRFDPNPNVQKSMNDIWTALVKDSNAVIDQNFESIIEDLLKSIVTGKEWRVRQASCAAIAEIIQGRDVEKYERYLDEMWTKAFKVSDDIKESVRVAAMNLCRTLTSLLIRNLEVGEGTTKRAQKMLDHAMPFLLRQLESGAAKESQDNAIRTLLKVIKKCPPKALQGYAPVVLQTLVTSLSSLEHESINYVHMNAEKYGLSAEELDRHRVSNVGSSTAIQAIERCLDSLDDDGMPEAMKRLEGCFKSLIDLPSKVGFSQVLVTLAVRHHIKFRPHADRFVKQLRKHLLDRNETVTNSYCLALAYLMRIASDDETRETCDFAKRLYFASEEVRQRLVAGELVHAISKVSNDRFTAFASAFLPFAFIGRNDIDTQARESFKKTWEDNVGGSRAVVLYLSEIIDLAQHIKSAQWGIKHTIASAVADLVVSLDSAVDGEYSLAQAAAIWPLLEKALGGKTWDGKEVVVASFPKFVGKAQALWASQGGEMKKIALREAKRSNPEYRPHSISALGEIANIFGGSDLAEKALVAMGEVAEEVIEASNNHMEVDPTGGSLASEAKRDARYALSESIKFFDLLMLDYDSLDRTLAAVIECCFKAAAFSKSLSATEENLQLLMTILTRSIPKGSKLSYLASYEGIRIFYANHNVEPQPKYDGSVVEERQIRSDGEVGFDQGIASLLLDNGNSPTKSHKYSALPENSNAESVRTARARAVLSLVSSDAYQVQDPEVKARTLMAVKLWLQSERSGQVGGILQEAGAHLVGGLRQGNNAL